MSSTTTPATSTTTNPPQRAKRRAKSRSRPRAAPRHEGIDLDPVTIRGAELKREAMAIPGPIEAHGAETLDRDVERSVLLQAAARADAEDHPVGESTTTAERRRFAIERCAVLDEARDPLGAVEAWEALALVLAEVSMDEWGRRAHLIVGRHKRLRAEAADILALDIKSPLPRFEYLLHRYWGSPYLWALDAAAAALRGDHARAALSTSRARRLRGDTRATPA